MVRTTLSKRDGCNMAPGCVGVLMAVALLLRASDASADSVGFAAPFGDHMVLQRDCDLTVWGQAEPNAEVRVSLADQTATATAGADGRWTCKLKPLSGPGPFTLSAVSGSARAAVLDVLVGDVWLCSGQSNMVMRVGDCADDKRLADGAGKFTNLRLCTVANQWKETPQSAVKMDWTPASKDSALATSAVGYFFATELKKDAKLADVPIGVVVSAVGGTLCEAWMSPATLQLFKPEELHPSLFGLAPGSLYNGMIAPLGQASFKGVVWYQGEGNAAEPDIYAKKVRTMIHGWREQFGQPDLPLLIIQLPDWADRSGMSWAGLRGAQWVAATCEPHASLVVTINSTDGWNLHPKEKYEVGRRAALVALRRVYQREMVVDRGPTKSGFKRQKDGSVRIRFHFDGALKTTAADGLVHGFTVAGTDGVFRDIPGRIDGDAVVLPTDGSVRYAWSGVPGGTLTDASGLPAWPFDAAFDKTAASTKVVTQSQQADLALSSSRYELKVDAMGEVISLIVGGKQFLSNESGPTGGTYMPGFLGPRLLPQTRLQGPTEIACSDATLTLTIDGREDQITWTFDNRDPQAVPYRINLSPLVEVGPVEQSSVTLRRDNVTARVSTVAAVKTIDGVKGLEMSLAPREKTTATWAFPANETKPR